MHRLATPFLVLLLLVASLLLASSLLGHVPGFPGGSLGIHGHSAPGTACRSLGADEDEGEPQYDRVLVIPDIHGDLEQTLNALRTLKAVNQDGAWAAGRALLVQTGDLVDRGHHSLEVMDLFASLKVQAEAAGGKVVTLLGNHEAMLIQGDYRFFSRQELMRLGQTRTSSSKSQGSQQAEGEGGPGQGPTPSAPIPGAEVITSGVPAAAGAAAAPVLGVQAQAQQGHQRAGGGGSASKATLLAGVQQLSDLLQPQAKYGRMIRQRPVAYISAGSLGGPACDMLLVHAAALPWMLDAVDKLQAPSSPPPTDGRGGSGGSNAAGHGRGVAHTLEGGVGVAGEAPGASQQQAAGQGIGPGRPASSGSTQGGSTGSTSGSRAGELRHLRHSGAAEGGAGVGHGIAGGQGTGSTTGGSGTSSVQLLPATMPSHRQLAEEGEGGQGQGQVAEAGEQQEHREPSRLDRLAQGKCYVSAWNAAVREALANCSTRDCIKRTNAMAGAMLGGQGAIWSRHYVSVPDHELCRAVREVLKRMGVSRIVVGHTIMPGGEIAQECGGALLLIDIGMSLEIGGTMGEVVGLECRPVEGGGQGQAGTGYELVVKYGGGKPLTQVLPLQQG